MLSISSDSSSAFTGYSHQNQNQQQTSKFNRAYAPFDYYRSVERLQNSIPFQLQRTKGQSINRPTMFNLKKSNQYHRLAIDLPTTEPFLEYCASDCDDYHENRLNSAKNNNLRIQLRSDARPRTYEKGIPNELIITSSQKQDTSTADENGYMITEIKEKLSNVMVSELPAIRGSKRNNIPWKNMKK